MVSVQALGIGSSILVFVGPHLLLEDKWLRDNDQVAHLVEMHSIRQLANSQIGEMLSWQP